MTAPAQATTLVDLEDWVALEVRGPAAVRLVRQPGQPSWLRPADPAPGPAAPASRRADLAAGRAAAHHALAAIGISTNGIPRGAGGAPCWPPGVTGSITHTREVAVALAAVPSEHGRVSVGIDAERHDAVTDDVFSTVFSPAEIAWLGSVPEPVRRRLATTWFCAKEAAYKARFPLIPEILDYPDVAIVTAVTAVTAVAAVANVATVATGAGRTDRFGLADAAGSSPAVTYAVRVYDDAGIAVVAVVARTRRPSSTGDETAGAVTASVLGGTPAGSRVSDTHS
ncbi:MAG: 4'-phosphopantetheinyl transferase superfamily protein [Ilumatobacteraceae bacterium]